MKKRFLVPAMAMLLCSSVMFSSCVGSFSLFNRLLVWNQTVDDKFINELIFVIFWIVPVYPIACVTDVLVLNSIEFWTGENPVADGTVKHVKGEKGNYTIVTQKDGYHIEKDGTDDVVDFRFDKENKVWSVEANGELTPLARIVGDDQALVFLPDGTQMPVSLNKAGVLAFKQFVRNKTFYAGK